MAFNPQFIPATDFYPNVGVGINIPFSNPQCFISNYTSQAALKNNILNFFLTEPGERIDNPNFGGGLRSFVFEQINSGTFSGIEDDISSKLSTQFPSVVLNRVNVDSIPDTNTIKVTIKYSIPQQGVLDEIEINFG